MTSNTFIIANIKLLIEMSEDGTYQIHEDRTQIEFNPCGDLPPIRTNENNDMKKMLSMMYSSPNKIKWNGGDNNSQDKIQNTTKKEDDFELIKEEEIKVYKHELKEKSKIPSVTTTLKNHHVKNNITKRQRIHI